MEIGSNLKKHRKKLKLTINEMSSVLKNKGINLPTRTIGSYERGERMPPADRYFQILDVCPKDVSQWYIESVKGE